MRGRPFIWHLQASATVELALASPVLVVLITGVFDIGRALVICEQTASAAVAISLAAEKLSVTPGSSTTSLTETQMQAAMSTIYAQIPGLNLGNGTGSFPGNYSVTLSSIVFLPFCDSIASAGCSSQTPYVAWTTSLAEPAGAAQLLTGIVRTCGTALTPVKQFPDDATQLTTMVDPNLQAGQTIILAPQIVTDVSYVYTPMFSLFLKSFTIHASATAPTPIGDTKQQITFNTLGQTGRVTSCVLP